MFLPTLANLAARNLRDFGLFTARDFVHQLLEDLDARLLGKHMNEV
jgi:hypothetical protein